MQTINKGDLVSFKRKRFSQWNPFDTRLVYVPPDGYQGNIRVIDGQNLYYLDNWWMGIFAPRARHQGEIPFSLIELEIINV